MDDLPIEKISISGPALASAIQRFSSSHADVDGLLFGHVSRLPPPDLHDDDDDPSSSSSTSSALSVSITGHFCFGSPMSFYDSMGRVDQGAICRAAAGDHRLGDCTVVGWFSGRRQSPLRPSMREFAVTVSLSQTLKTLTLVGESPAQSQGADLRPHPCIFLLLSTSASPNMSVHTHEYRAFELLRRPKDRGCTLEPRSVNVINVGPAFRGQYASFSPESAFPWFTCDLVEGKEGGDARTHATLPRASPEQPALDRLAEGFGVDRLRQMVGAGASQYRSELEDMYGGMLSKLEGLARLVEKSSLRVLEQEARNLKLRNKIAGLE